MKTRRLKKFVLPTVYLLIIVTSFISITLINKYVNNVNSDYDFVKSIMKEESNPVLNEVNESKFNRPYVDESVLLYRNYYNKNDDNETQINSLLNYESTYMPSTGCMYSSDSEFDVVTVFPGTVTKIKEDEVLGKMIEVTHNPNLISYYYSVDNIKIEENAVLPAGTIIATSSKNKLSEKNNNLYFEVYFQGKSVDPEDFYNLNPNEME